jgi:glucose-1-phosphate thymidylyltransferase
VSPSKAVVLVGEPRASGWLPGGPNQGGFDGQSANVSSAPALAQVANRPLFVHALDWLHASGVKEVMIVASKKYKSVLRSVIGGGERWRFEASWLDELPTERLRESLGRLAAFVEDEPFVLHFADSLAKQGLAELLGGRTPAANEALLVVQPCSRSKRDDRVIDLRTRLPGRLGLRNGAPAGVAVLGSRMTAAGAALDDAPEPALELLAERVRELGGTLETRAAGDWWRFRSGTRALLEGNRFALEGQRPDFDAAQLVDSDIQGAVVAHPSARITSSVVRGPAVVGAGARLDHAYVGPYSSVGDDVTIEGAELENSIILPGASISHLGRRLEASVVGAKARVFRDFRLPSALRLTIGEGAEISLA